MQQYYRSVKASEKPKVNGFYNGLNGTAKVPCVLYFQNGIWHDEDGMLLNKQRAEMYEYIVPTQLPDAAVLRSALEDMAHRYENVQRLAEIRFNELTKLKEEKKRYNSIDLHEAQILKTVWGTMAKSAREALSAGDGWIRVEDGLPEHNVGVLVYIPMEDDHITSGMWDIDNKWVLLDEYRVVGEGEGMEECEVTHWMPMPSKPLNK